MTKKTTKDRYSYVQPAAVQEAAPKKPARKTPAKKPTAPVTSPEPAPVAVPVQPSAATGAAAALRDPELFRLPPPQRGRAAADGVQRRGDVEREQMNVRIRPELKRAAASLAGLHGTSLGDVIEAALVEYIRKQQG
ncbi:hypothetical protein GCM10008959_40910 [Deinococcus seoulensis]|uniref:CopG family transcriptional regulator n=1 Tax=Deinococcus seoulensis TaxID=1837379 RepID=A0ABQ2RWV8_9DEIO|nr:hypothetical protein [Deinococcus seoulensis]GGR75749.1 hypothetical protein GCM10008959_40910 [Deinococcus seoulensis]